MNEVFIAGQSTQEGGRERDPRNCFRAQSFIGKEKEKQEMLTRASMGDSRRKVSRRASMPKSLHIEVASENENPPKHNLTSKVVRCDSTVSILARQLAPSSPLASILKLPLFARLKVFFAVSLLRDDRRRQP